MSRTQNRPPTRLDGGAEALLAAVLRLMPKFTDPACHGHVDLFDPPGEREERASVVRRHEVALRLCADCPCLDACRAWAATEPPTGAVLAGRITNDLMETA
ncbi:WhiB family transcriptional regulator [Gordonia sp. DT219]|uniref:WhiB family transcriptional regulator n=1 Tax=Gordonia sp. DT219 TaxID=3416658 RepID=UPI003CE68C3E